MFYVVITDWLFSLRVPKEVQRSTKKKKKKKKKKSLAGSQGAGEGGVIRTRNLSTNYYFACYGVLNYCFAI